MIEGSTAIWATVILAGAGTYAIRVSFMLVADRFDDLPPTVTRVLRMIPPAALAALTVPAVLRPDGELDVTNPRFAAAVLAGIAGYFSKSALVTLVVGFASLSVIEWLI